MRNHFIITFLFVILKLSAQEAIDFRSLLEAAVENSPRLGDKELLDHRGALNVENVRTSWYPSLTLNGKVSYQSDVVSIDMNIPGVTFPEMPHEQYAVNIDLHQNIYDGGFSKQRTAYEEALTAASIKQVDVDLYALKNKVVDLYFAILTFQENKANMLIVLENLKAREAVLMSAVQNGAAFETDKNIISVEILKTLQAMAEIDASKDAALEMLEIYTGIDIPDAYMFETPFLEMEEAFTITRPEFDFIDLQAEVMEAGKNLVSVKRMPRIYAFGQTGIGMPGYNMLNSESDTYLMIGAGLQWNIWDWNSTKREKQILETKKQELINARDNMEMNILAGISKQQKLMLQKKKALELDEEMLKMRMGITQDAASRLDKGVISATDYLQVLNDENLTRVQTTLHKVQLMRSIANYKFLEGSL